MGAWALDIDKYKYVGVDMYAWVPAGWHELACVCMRMLLINRQEKFGTPLEWDASGLQNAEVREPNWTICHSSSVFWMTPTEAAHLKPPAGSGTFKLFTELTWAMIFSLQAFLPWLLAVKWSQLVLAESRAARAQPQFRGWRRLPVRPRHNRIGSSRIDLDGGCKTLWCLSRNPSNASWKGQTQLSSSRMDKIRFENHF